MITKFDGKNYRILSISIRQL